MSILSKIPSFVMPFLLVILACILVKNKNKNVMEIFFSGCFDGLENCVKLVPTMIVVFSGVGLLFASCGIDVILNTLRPLFVKIGIPVDILPLVILRPFSGSSVTAVADKIFENTGPDSIVSKTASVFLGSTDTIIYTIAVYFSAIKAKKTGYAVFVSLVVMIFSVMFSVFAVRLFL